MKRAAFFFILITSSPAFSAEERWNKYWECESNTIEAVEQAEPSIWDGADLIVDALCVFVATELANDMVKSRPELAAQPFWDGFKSAKHVIRRETAIKIYNKRVLRMGLRSK